MCHLPSPSVHDEYLFSCAHHTLSPEQENSNIKHKKDKLCCGVPGAWSGIFEGTLC